MMRKNPTSPCAKCPYRRDAPIGKWHRDHYQSVLDADANPLSGVVFMCHGHIKLPPEERGYCAGWLNDQKERGAPSIALRLRLGRDDETAAAFAAVSDGGHEVYESAKRMAEVNLRAIDTQEERRARVRRTDRPAPRGRRGPPP